MRKSGIDTTAEKWSTWPPKMSGRQLDANPALFIIWQPIVRGRSGQEPNGSRP